MRMRKSGFKSGSLKKEQNLKHQSFFKMTKTSYKAHIQKHLKHSLINTKITSSASKHKTL